MAIDLCTREQVRSHGQFPDGQTEQGPLIDELITDTSRAIMEHCQREFAPAGSAGVERSFGYDARRRLAPFRQPWDLRAATAVVLDKGQPEEATLLSTQWRLALPDDEWSVFRGLELNYVTTYGVWKTRRLSVTGTWGFATVPEPVKRACVLTVLAQLRGDIRAFAGPLQPNSMGPEANQPVAFPPGVRGLLRPFRRTR